MLLVRLTNALGRASHFFSIIKLDFLFRAFLWRMVLISLHLPTSESNVLREKLIGSQLVKKLPAYYGTRMYITSFTRVRHLPLSWARPIQFMHPYPITEDPA